MNNNNKFKFLFFAFLAISACFIVILTIQGLSISDLKKNNEDLRNQLEESKAVSKSNVSNNVEKSEYVVNYDEDYVKFIKEELIPKIDKKEFLDICKRSSTYFLYICELDVEYYEDEGIKYFDKLDEIGEKVYIDGAEDINEFDLDYKTFGVGVSKLTNKSGFILMHAGAIEGIRIEEPWIEVLNYDDYGRTLSAGAPVGEGIMYIFPDVKKGSEIEIKLSEDLAKLLEFDNDIIKINVK